jgi:hypothetical protein
VNVAFLDRRGDGVEAPVNMPLQDVARGRSSPCPGVKRRKP